MTTDQPARYRMFVLTVWQEEAGALADPETWRIRLEEPKSGRRQGCVGVAALVETLINEMDDGAAPPEDGTPGSHE